MQSYGENPLTSGFLYSFCIPTPNSVVSLIVFFFRLSLKVLPPFPSLLCLWNN